MEKQLWDSVKVLFNKMLREIGFPCTTSPHPVFTSLQWRTEGGFVVFNPPPTEILKALQNCAKLNLICEHLKIAEFRTPTPQDVRKKRQ